MKEVKKLKELSLRLGVKADSTATHKQRKSINRSIGFNS